MLKMLLVTFLWPGFLFWICRINAMTFRTFGFAITIKNRKIARALIAEKNTWGIKTSRNKELFCPCGCGTNLILVAGEKQLREQHFRIDDDNYNSACEYVSEGKVSVQSKIVLKCWLDDKLDSAEIETRVPIYAIDDIDRKFEFSLIDRENGVAISYHYERASLSDEKLEILESNSKGLQILYVIDKKNRSQKIIRR